MLGPGLNWETLSGRQFEENVEDHQNILGEGPILAGDRGIIRRGCPPEEELGASILRTFDGNLPWVFAGLALASLHQSRYLGQMFSLGPRVPNVIGQSVAGITIYSLS
jgi:hypothetical protein